MIRSSTVKSSSAKPQIAKRGDARRTAFVEAGRELLFAEGYGGLSMSSLAAKAGGSKSTLWSYFPSKEALFAAIVDDIVERYGAALNIELDLARPLADMLGEYATAVLEALHSTQVVHLYRLVVGEAGRFPALARLLYEKGQQRGTEQLAAYLTQAIAKGWLRGDPDIAAKQFCALCQGGSFQLHTFALAGKPTRKALALEADAIVATFLRGWTA